MYFLNIVSSEISFSGLNNKAPLIITKIGTAARPKEL